MLRRDMVTRRIGGPHDMSDVFDPDRNMSEYEAANFWALHALGQVVLAQGADETLLLAKLSGLKKDAEAAGRRNEAACYGMLITMWCEPPRSYEPASEPPPSN